MGTGILLSASSDIDFMIHGIFQYEIFGQKVWITTTHVCLLIVMAIIMIFCLLANRAVKRATEVPGAFQNVVELIVEMLDGMVKSSMGIGGFLCMGIGDTIRVTLTADPVEEIYAAQKILHLFSCVGRDFPVFGLIHEASNIRRSI